MGCGCKKKNQPISNQTVNIQLTEGTTTKTQEVVIMEEQIDQIIKKVEEISQQINEDSTQEQ